MPLPDTRQKDKNLTDLFVADLVLQILSYVAQTERMFIRQRQAEGIAVAKVRGVRFGRPMAERTEVFGMLLEKWESKEISAREAARKLGITHITFLVWVKKEGWGIR